MEHTVMTSRITTRKTPVGKAAPGTKPKYPGADVNTQSAQEKFCSARLTFVLGRLLTWTNSSGCQMMLLNALPK